MLHLVGIAEVSLGGDDHAVVRLLDLYVFRCQPVRDHLLTADLHRGVVELGVVLKDSGKTFGGLLQPRHVDVEAGVVVDDLCGRLHRLQVGELGHIERGRILFEVRRLLCLQDYSLLIGGIVELPEEVADVVVVDLLAIVESQKVFFSREFVGTLVVAEEQMCGQIGVPRRLVAHGDAAQLAGDVETA